MESTSLRVVFPVVFGRERVECVMDTGSQIVSMALKLAERMGMFWDPDITIYMQSANGQLKKSAGLARNVPFAFGDITVYLQVHIIDQPAYQILLGRPFDVLTESITQNHRNGSQSVTIRDPNSGKRITLPTHARGSFSAEPPEAKDVPMPVPGNGKDKENTENIVPVQPGREADFQGSSRT